MCDFTADWSKWLDKCRETNRSVRRNLDPTFIQKAEPEAIHEAAVNAVRAGQGFGGFILGTAVVPYATPTENLLAVKQACVEAGV